MPEDERRARVGMLAASVPEGVDLDSLLGGELAGPESTDRPPVPVWEYPRYVESHSGITLDDLGPQRFPFRNEHGDTALTSIDELREPGPGAAGVRASRRDVVDLYAALYAAGLLRWDAATRTVVHADVPTADVAAIVAAWRDRVAAAPGD